MALDVGEKTIGVAFTDEAGTMAFPGETIVRQEGFRRDMAKLRALVAEREVNRIVIGIPLLADGSHGVMADRVEAFIGQLRGSVRVPIDRQDEGYTTAEADALLDEAGRPRAGRKRTIDSLAACLILRDYLARQQAARPEVAEAAEVGSEAGNFNGRAE
jgi:putative holliday junction resolvase